MRGATFFFFGRKAELQCIKKKKEKGTQDTNTPVASTALPRSQSLPADTREGETSLCP
jgi:hypothetical protein